MKFLATASIKRKQMLIILLTSAATLLLACSAFLFYDVATFRRELVARANSVAEVTGNNCTAALDFNDSHSAEEALKALRGERSIVAAAIYKADGSEFAKYRREDAASLQITAPAQPKSAHDFTSTHLILYRPIIVQDEKLGTVVLVYNLAEMSNRLVRYLIIVAVVFGASLLVAFILSNWLQRVISGPIHSLARAARAVAIGKDYSVRVQKQSEDELGQLMDGFNEMLSQIQQRDAALQAARDHLEQRVKERTLALANSLSLLNATLESTADGILVVDQGGRVTNFNAKFLEMWRIPKEIVLQGRDNDVLPLAVEQMKDEQAFLSKVRQLYEHPEVQSIDILELKDGRVFERHSQPQRVQGNYVGRVWCFRDITERKHAEEALRERLTIQERLAKIATAVPGVIHTLKLRSDGAMSMPYASPRVQEIYGVRPEEIEQDAAILKSLIHRDDRAAIMKSLQECARAMTPWRAEYRVNHPQLGEIWVEGFSMPEADGDSVLWHGFLSNITERKRLETKMSALNKELIETSRQAGMAEVATGVLHNVGNVLNSVNVSATLVTDSITASKAVNLSKVAQLLEDNANSLGEFMTSARGKQILPYLRQLAEQLAADRKKEIAELELLRKNIEHIKEIVAMQQSYAKVSGVTETVRVEELVEDALQMNAGSLDRHEVQVVREFSEVPPVTLEKHKVLQILVNLIRNAKYACDDSGRKDKRLTLRIAPVHSGVQISVADNGVGIPAENMTRIFNHGFTTRKSGHGFGLHSGALVAKEMGGNLKVESEGIGKGATFILELPLQPQSGHHA